MVARKPTRLDIVDDRRMNMVLPFVRSETRKHGGLMAGDIVKHLKERYGITIGHESAYMDMGCLIHRGLAEYVYPYDFLVGDPPRQIHAYRSV